MKNFDWKEVWERKGKLQTNDLKELDGFEATTIDPKKAALKIKKVLKIKKTDKVLEVGCGAGMIAKYLDCDYTGADYSESLVKKHTKLLGHKVVHTEAKNLPFEDKSFDKVFVYSVFHYFPNKEYAKEVIKELKEGLKRRYFYW